MAVSLMSLWLPILISSALVFIASSIVHMFTPFHRGDLRGLPREDEVMSALRPFSLTPGDYGMPFAGGTENMKSAAFQERMRKGPVAFITVRPSGTFSMRSTLVVWFIYSIVVSFVHQVLQE